MKVLGIIPARAGSKRVAGKNIRPLAEKPLIQYTIDAAKKAGCLIDTIVTTDSEEIAELTNKIGGKAPFLRPSEFAADKAGDRSVIKHAIEWYEQNVTSIDAICYLRPTAPFRTAETITQVVEHFCEIGADSVRSVTRVEGVHHPYWMYKRDSNGTVESAVPGVSIEEYFQSQLLPPVFRLNGVVDVILKDAVLDTSSPLYGENMEIFELEESVSVDIDTEDDFKYCEWLIQQK